MTTKSIPFIILLAATTGILWLAAAASFASDVTVCLFKNVTGIPCPSCGSTRAALLLLQGHPVAALMMNPLGVLTVVAGIGAVVLALADLAGRRLSLQPAWSRFDSWLHAHPAVLTTCAVLVAANWVWNIAKHL